MSTGVFLLTISLPLLAAVIVFAMKYAAIFAAARAAQSENGVVRALAEQNSINQVQTAASLQAIQTDVAQLLHSMSAVETMLKHVE